MDGKDVAEAESVECVREEEEEEEGPSGSGWPAQLTLGPSCGPTGAAHSPQHRPLQ